MRHRHGLLESATTSATHDLILVIPELLCQLRNPNSEHKIGMVVMILWAFQFYFAFFAGILCVIFLACDPSFCMYNDANQNFPLFASILLPPSILLILHLVVPGVPPAEQNRAVLFRAVHQLPSLASSDMCRDCTHTKNHMEAPRPVAMNLYKGRTGWILMGWFGISAYLGGPILRSVGCMVNVEPVE